MSILISFIVITVVASWWVTGWLVRKLSAKGIVDAPNQRTLHQGAIPRGGGLVVVASLLLVMMAMAVMTSRYLFFLALSICVLCWSLLSWVDDQTDLSPRLRLIVQCVFAALTIAAFGYITELRLGVDWAVPLSVAGALITFIGILWFANLYNFMDGMDGLAASQTIIGAITIGIWFWHYGDQALAIVCFILAASSYGFLLWNWQPAKIFMGDVGSVSTGAFFATLMVIAVSRYQMPILSFIFLFWVFVADASATIVRRIVKREPFWKPHRSHYYQRLANVGLAHNKIVIALIGLMLLCSIIASITLLHHDTITVAVGLVLGLFGVGVVTVILIEAYVQNNKKK